MNNKEFVNKLIQENLVKQFNSYFDYFVEYELENVKDPYWKQIFQFYTSIEHTDTNIKGLKTFIYLSMTDTISNILDVLDNNTVMKGELPLKLVCGNEVINGDLQDIFLGNIEDNPPK
jgi:hypothetical protein